MASIGTKSTKKLEYNGVSRAEMRSFASDQACLLGFCLRNTSPQDMQFSFQAQNMKVRVFAGPNGINWHKINQKTGI